MVVIVVIDSEGPYVLEGGYRFDALRELGAQSFPARVVVDLDSIQPKNTLQNHSTSSPSHEVSISSPVIAPIFLDTIDFPFSEGVPSIIKTSELKKWINQHRDRYSDEKIVLYHATSASIPIEEKD
jgi:hypothetical protein